MASEPSPPESLPAIQNEHQELLSLVKSIKRRLASSPWQDPMVPSLLDSLREHLESHFEFEESDDGFDHLVQKAPWVEPRVEALIAEHRKMLSLRADVGEFVDQFVRRGRVADIVDRDARPLLGETDRRRPADAGGAPRDQDPFARKSAHRRLPPAPA